MSFLLSNNRGWGAFSEDIKSFCKVLRFTPTHEQLNYLLRVQLCGTDGVRLGMDLGAEQEFAVVTVATLFRALVHKRMSFLFYEHKSDADLWIQRMVKFVAHSDDIFTGQVKVSKQRQFLVANTVHVCHLVGPFADETEFGQGLHDTVMLNFDDMPTERIRTLLDLARGSVVYLPLQKD